VGESVYWGSAREAGRDVLEEAAAGAGAGAGGTTSADVAKLLLEDAARVGGQGATSTFSSGSGLWELAHFEDRTPLYLSFYTRTLSLVPPPTARACLGGIIADEMGLGKTVELTAIIAAHMEAQGWLEPPAAASAAIEDTQPEEEEEEEQEQEEEEEDDVGFVRGKATGKRGAGRASAPRAKSARSAVPDEDDWGSDDNAPEDEEGVCQEDQAVDNAGNALPKTRATLIIAPMVLMSQWLLEIEKYTATGQKGWGGRRSLRVLVHHGPTRAKSARTFRDFDVVVTSYGTASAEFSAASRAAEDGPGASAPLFGVRWERIALDEAHTIKNAASQQAKACCAVKAKFRWALTGTPIHNSLLDIFSLIRFLRHEPWSELGFWKRAVGEPFEKRDARAPELLKALLRPILLRRTKTMMDTDGRCISSELPPAHVAIINIDLSPAERAFYEAVYSKSKARFLGLVATKKVMTAFASIFTLLLRLRQCCDHPVLVMLGASAVSSEADRKEGGGASAADSGMGADFVTSLYAQWRLGQGRRMAALNSARSSSSSSRPPSRQSEVSATQPEDEGDDLRSFVLSQVQELQREGVSGHTCPVCLDALIEGSASGLPCFHLVCSDCVQLLEQAPDGPACPICRQPFEPSAVVDGRTLQPAAGAGAGRGSARSDDIELLLLPHVTTIATASGGTAVVHRGKAQAAEAASAGSAPQAMEVTRDALRDAGRTDIPSSTKLDVLVAHLNAIGEHNASYDEYLRSKAAEEEEEEAAAAAEEEETTSPPAPGGFTTAPPALGGMVLADRVKAIVFSQFVSMLDLCEANLTRAGLGRRYVRLDGSMTAKVRDEAIASFRSKPDVFVFLISLKAGGLGLNLTTASVVFMIDPWWNPAIEDQALARVHRMGQTKQVYVRRLVARKTIEEQLIAIQEAKRAIATTVLSAGAGGGGAGGAAGSKLTEEDLRTFFVR
jgi:SNF2 family DNA or RNA helicase